MIELNSQSCTFLGMLEKAESPVVIEQRARSLGMVPAGSSGVVQLDKGLVSGGSTSDSAK